MVSASALYGVGSSGIWGMDALHSGFTFQGLREAEGKFDDGKPLVAPWRGNEKPKFSRMLQHCANSCPKKNRSPASLGPT